jgi:DNA-binding response OmpR family regulator
MGKKVLVVDDEMHILNILKFNLKKAGYDVTTAADGEEAMQKINLDPPELILCDVMMPKKTGFEVCYDVKTNEKLKSIKFIILTAKGQRIDEEKGIEYGADLYLTKPFSPRNILAKVKELLNE